MSFPQAEQHFIWPIYGAPSICVLIAKSGLGSSNIRRRKNSQNAELFDMKTG
jgi:hypothetical protein